MDQQEEIRMDQEVMVWSCIMWIKAASYMKRPYPQVIKRPQITVNRPCRIELYSDSKYLTDAFNQNWISGWIAKGWNRGKSGPVKNIDLWKRLLKAKEQHQVTFIWVKGHAGHPQNERCDQLATTAADGTDLMVDEGLSL